MSIEKRID